MAAREVMQAIDASPVDIVPCSMEADRLICMVI